MKIANFDWNSFFVYLERKPQEAQDAYLKRALDCLKKFNDTYTTVNPPINPFWMLNGELELLLEAHNFCDMYLGTYCDVKYRVCPDGIGQHPAGISVSSHRIEDRRPQVEFLKQRWSEFRYDN